VPRDQLSRRVDDRRDEIALVTVHDFLITAACGSLLLRLVVEINVEV